MTHADPRRPSVHGCNPRERTPDAAPEEETVYIQRATYGQPTEAWIERRPHGLRHWRDARALLGCSIRKFAKTTGINRGQLSKIENGAAPTPDEARRILFVVDSFGPKR
jgi:DNA-binding transcriptional regulator YiaG